MTEESQLINDIITRWNNKQSIRAMARDLGVIGRAGNDVANADRIATRRGRAAKLWGCA